MDPIGLDRNGRGYGVNGNRLGVWSPGPALFLVHVVGHGEGAFAAPIIEEFERLTAAGARIHFFVDLGRMESYDSLLRTRCTEHFRAHLRTFDGFHVYAESRLVSMAVAVANVALSGIITMHTSRPSFVRALENQLALHGVDDFSSDVLSS